MDYYAAFRDEWSRTAGSPELRLETINAKMVAGPDLLVAITDVMAYLRENGLWLPIKAAQGTNMGAAAAVDLNEDLRAQTIDFGKPIVGQMLALLVQGGLLSSVQAKEIAAMKNTIQPWWQANGYPRAFDAGDVDAAGLV